MAGLNDYFPDVIEQYYNMIKSIDQNSGKYLDIKTRELILVAIGTSIGNVNVIKFHSKRALENGATKNELRLMALLPLPIVGLTKCNQAIDIIDKN